MKTKKQEITKVNNDMTPDDDFLSMFENMPEKNKDEEVNHSKEYIDRMQCRHTATLKIEFWNKLGKSIQKVASKVGCEHGCGIYDEKIIEEKETEVTVVWNSFNSFG